LVQTPPCTVTDAVPETGVSPTVEKSEQSSPLSRTSATSSNPETPPIRRPGSAAESESVDTSTAPV
jgi:hypothetical protein